MNRLTTALTGIGVWIGGLFLLGISFAIVIEVLLRKFANTSMQGIDEISGYAMAITFAWAMPFTILTRGHVRVDVLYGRMPPGVKLAFDVVAALAFALYLAVLAWQCGVLTLSSWQAGTLSSGILPVPLVIPQSAWTAGLGVAGVVLVLSLGRALLAVARGNAAVAIAALSPYDEAAVEARRAEEEQARR